MPFAWNGWMIKTFAMEQTFWICTDASSRVRAARLAGHHASMAAAAKPGIAA
jgi:hypothetical protein